MTSAESTSASPAGLSPAEAFHVRIFRAIFCGRTFNVRSIAFSLLGISMMSGLAGFHDWVLLGSPMIGNQLPVGAFSYMMFVGIFWNGLWALADRAWRALRPGAKRGPADFLCLSGREMAVVLVATLIACFPPTSGFFRYFQRQLMMPWHYLTNKPLWVKFGLLTTGDYWIGKGQLFDFHLRPELFPAPWPGPGGDVLTSAGYERVYTAFFSGMVTPEGPVPFSAIPWDAWVRPLLYWTPLVALMVLALLSLQFLVHRQWAHHEQLSYPIAQVAGAFCATRDGRRGVPDLFRNRLFWWGFFPVFLMLGLDYLASWYPDDVPALSTMMPNLRGWWLPFTTQVPALKNTYGGGYFFNGQTLYFSFLGISYFVSSEISLSVGVAPFLLAIYGLLFYSATGTVFTGGTLDAARSGAYLGYTLILLYTGRTYFKAVFGRALLPRGGLGRPGPLRAVVALLALLAFAYGWWRFVRHPLLAGHRALYGAAAALAALGVWSVLFGWLLRGRADAKPGAGTKPAADGAAAEDAAAAADLAAPDDVSVLAARVLLMAFAGFVLVLSWMCQSWLVAIFYSLLMLALFLVFSRIACETGIPFAQANWNPSDLLLNLFGAPALGPQATNFTVWGSSILTQDPREALMPYAATGAKVADDAGIPMRKVFRFAVVAVLAALAVAWFGSMFSLYNYNPMSDSWAARWTPTMYFDQTSQTLGGMEASGMLDETMALAPDGSLRSEFLAPLRRLGLAQPNAMRCHYILYGMAAVILLSMLRFRFSKFPLHPVMFLIMGTYPGTGAWGVFLLGWFVKQAVVRFGGGGVYQRLKPFFIGIISGELGMAGTALVVEFSHYLCYGQAAHVVGRFLPG